MPELFGHTRAHVGVRHALFTPANHVNSSVPGITGATAVVLINEALGAKFAQTLVTFQDGGRAGQTAGAAQTFGYFMSGGGGAKGPRTADLFTGLGGAGGTSSGNILYSGRPGDPAEHRADGTCRLPGMAQPAAVRAFEADGGRCHVGDDRQCQLGQAQFPAEF